MVTRRGRAIGAGEYVARMRGAGPVPVVPVTTAEQLAETGVAWAEFDASRIQPSDLERARHRFRAALPELIWNAAALEGNTFTLPEVRTLLDGVTVGGHRTEDENQILALSDAYNELDGLVGAGEFRLDKAISDRLNRLVARHEAIEAGHFRGEGAATGGGAVHLARGGSIPGTPHGPGGELLRQRFVSTLGYLATIADPRERALVYFAATTRTQYYFDGNKRTARLMMSGELMSHGYDVVNIPYARRLEFNRALDQMFTGDDATNLLRFLADCPSG